MIPYTKPICRISPLFVDECQLRVGRSFVALALEYGNGARHVVHLTLPDSHGKHEDSLLVSHQLHLDPGDDPTTAEVFDHVLKTVGFRPESEKVQ